MSGPFSRRQFIGSSAKVLGAVALSGLASQLLAGCAKPVQPAATSTTPAAPVVPAPAPPKQLKVPRIAFTSPTQPAYVHSQAGPLEYGSRLGLDFKDIDLLQFQSHAVATQTVLAGRADIVAGSTVSHLALMDQGRPFKIFAPFNNIDSLLLAARTKVTAVEDLIKPGVKIAVDSPGGAANMIINAMLKAKGVKFRVKDLPGVTILESSGLRATALASGNVDVALIRAEQFAQIQEKLGASEVKQLTTLYASTPQYVMQSYAAPQAWLDANLEEATKLNIALLKATRELTASYELFSKMVRKYIAGGGPEEKLLKGVWDHIREYDYWPVNGGLEPEGMAFMIDLSLEEGLIKQKLDAAGCIDRRSLDAALKELGRIEKKSLLS